MKLNKYICKRLSEIDYAVTEDDVDEWIFEWYQEIYDRQPPMWLAGDRWYDRRKRKIKEAKELEEQNASKV